MSWSFSATGKPVSVVKKAKADLTNYKCAEPEESIKLKVLDMIETCLTAFPEGSAVTIEANGSQSTDTSGKFINSLLVSIKPIYGFIE